MAELVRSLKARNQLFAAQPSTDGTLLDELQRIQVSAAAKGSGLKGPMLFLSGGSQDGAFGAGYLNGWSKARGGTDEKGALPRFAVVTGISTGAILSTWAFINDPGAPARAYRIGKENEILEPFVSGRAGEFKVARTLVRRGAVGDLIPLRRLISSRLQDKNEKGLDVLQQVAAGHEDDRKLFVGAVDVDSGEAVAFDMTEMASRYATETDEGRKSLITACYVEAIIASSAVPIAALPVFIDNRMYIDGGARFGLFSEEVGEAIRQRTELNKALHTSDQRYFAIVNGDLTLGDRCGKADESLCQPPHPRSGGAYGAHRSWSLADLGGRSVSVLINQGYRFSAAHLNHRAKELNIPFKLARIEPDMASHRYRLRDPDRPSDPHPVLGGGEMGCADWQKFDRDTDHPLEFHPRFMHCLVAYGEWRGANDGWAQLN